MKSKIWALGLLSLAGLALSTTPADAWLLNHWCRHCYTTQINIRPYNAFTPICSGNLTCDGGTPNPCALAAGCCSFPSYGGGMPFGDACAGGACAMHPGMTAPVANYAPMPVPTQTAQYGVPMQYYGVQPAGYMQGYNYNPYYYAGYNPYGYQPNMMWPAQYYGQR